MRLINKYFSKNRTNPPQLSNFHLGYRPALDGVRGISILVVLFHHGYLFLYGRGGFLGVDIFFVLSGFLITTLLTQEWEEAGTISFKKFYSRRALRLFPGLFVLILVTSVQTILFPPETGLGPVFRHLIAVFFYMSNWIDGNLVIGHTWSLSIEEQFYIAWPILLFLMLKMRFSRGKILGALSFGLFAIVLYRASLYYFEYRSLGDQWNYRIYTGTDTRSDSLLVGCIAGLLMVWQLIPRKRAVLYSLRIIAYISCTFLSVLIIFVPIYWPYLYYGVFTLVAIAVASILIHLMVFKDSLLNRLLQFPVLTWLGRLSYSLYLWHVTAFDLYEKLFKPFTFRSYSLRLFLPLVIQIAGSVLLACISYYFIERPFLQMKKRFSSVSPIESPQIASETGMGIAKAVSVGT